MKTTTKRTTTGLALLLLATPAFADIGLLGGETSLWIQGVKATNGIDDGSRCNAGGTEFCASAPGFGAYGGTLFALPNGAQLYGDLTFDFHRETDSDSTSRSHPARYAGLGLHYLFEMAGNPSGAFLTTMIADNHADSDKSGVLLGAGLETMWNDYYVQAGYAHTITPTSSSNIDGPEDFFFAKAGRTFDFAGGELEASLMVGSGDFEDGNPVAPGDFLQIGLRYTAPLGNTKLNWFAGYQGDYVSSSGGSFEQVFLHTAQIGIEMTFGGQRSPFKTPNFRAVMSNAGEIN